MTLTQRHSRHRVFTGIASILAFLLCLCTPVQAQMTPPPLDPLSFSGPDVTEQFGDISIEQKLNAQLDLDLTFTSSDGQPVKLRDLMNDKPALLAFVYYECPQLCQAELAGLEVVVKAMKYKPGQDYNIITVSIDPGETPEMAAAKKRIHVDNVNREGTEAGWNFLVGSESSIEQLAGQAGFRYIYDPATDMYAHAAGIMAVTADGRISRYFYGIEYIKRDVEWGLTEASEGRIGSLVDKVVLLCFQYDPTKGAYGIYVIGALRVGATLMILGFALMYTLLYLRGRKKKTADRDADLEAPHSGVTS
ncbi:MAG: SCO family protein [Candidatus Hydrogenedentota bacterium]